MTVTQSYTHKNTEYDDDESMREGWVRDDESMSIEVLTARAPLAKREFFFYTVCRKRKNFGFERLS